MATIIKLTTFGKNPETIYINFDNVSFFQRFNDKYTQVFFNYSVSGQSNAFTANVTVVETPEEILSMI